MSARPKHYKFLSLFFFSINYYLPEANKINKWIDKNLSLPLISVIIIIIISLIEFIFIMIFIMIVVTIIGIFMAIHYILNYS